jgi:SAM-dependent methyltransferase
MNEELTSESYWSKYWKSKPKIDNSIVEADFLFHDVIEKYVPKKADLSFLEIGGYPGMWAVFFAKFWGARSSLLDRYIDRDVIQSLSKTNGVDTIEVIEGDVFELEATKQFDVVMSVGFIEHFSDVSSVVSKHIEFLKPDGTLILTVPNFLGLNGFVQKSFDRETYDTHYLVTMYHNKLKKIVEDQNMEVRFVSYYGKFGVWLEDINNKPRWIRRTIYLTNIVGKFMSRFETRLFSPYLVMVANRK